MLKLNIVKLPACRVKMDLGDGRIVYIYGVKQKHTNLAFKAPDSVNIKREYNDGEGFWVERKPEHYSSNEIEL